MLVNPARVPVPCICSHSMPVPWQPGQRERGGTKRLPHVRQRAPSLLLAEKALERVVVDRSGRGRFGHGYRLSRMV